MNKTSNKLNNFANNLKNALYAKGWSQNQLARKLGITQQCVSRWVKGNREPSIDDIILICYFLDEDPNELIGFNDLSPDELKNFDNLFENKN